jgi:glycosyltransferase involved in cell wall biosynthesis
MGDGTLLQGMKIVFTNDTIYGWASGISVVGGAERQQWLLARALAAIGWSVTVGVRKTLEVGERRTIDGVEFLGMGQGNIHRAWYRFLSSEHPDWWYWRCADHLWGCAVEIAKLAGVHTIFAAGFDTDVQPRQALFRRPHWWPLYAWGLSRTDRILVQHTGQLATLAPRWRLKAYIVPSITGEMAAVKPHFARAKYVAWVAMLRQPKRPDVLLEIARKAPAIRFIVCGGPTPFSSPPGYSEWIVEALQAQPNIEFLGKVAPQKTQQIIADAAMLLSTSDAEGFPNTFLEAWSSGTPVISLNIDPDHLIERQELGTVPGNVERATADILALMDSPQRRDEIAVRARRYVAEAHSEAAVTAVFEGALTGLRA